MELPPLLVLTTVRHRDGATVRAAGEVDFSTVRELDRVVAEAIQSVAAPGYVTLDLAAVTVFGSAGVAVLVKAKYRCRGRRLTLVVRPSPEVHRILRITGLAETIVTAPPYPPTGR